MLMRANQSTGDETLADKIKQGVLSQILDGRLRPGEMINLSDLASVYGTSKTPVRDALTALQEQGIIESLPYRGFFLRPIDINDLGEMHFVRELLECAAVGLACHTISDDELAVLEEIENRALALSDDGSNAAERDRVSSQFHLLVARASRNDRLYKMIEQIQLDVRRIQYARLHVPHSVQLHSEHSDIVAALKRHDFAAAVRAMREHLNHVAERDRETLTGRRGVPGVLADLTEVLDAS